LLRDVRQRAVDHVLVVRQADFGGDGGNGEDGERDCGDEAFHDVSFSVEVAIRTTPL
jgi:hypothetical protein